MKFVQIAVTSLMSETGVGSTTIFALDDRGAVWSYWDGPKQYGGAVWTRLDATLPWEDEQ